MDLPRLAVDTLLEYGWLALAPALLLIFVIIFRGQSRAPALLVLVVGTLIVFRNHPLLRDFTTGLRSLWWSFLQLFR